MIDPNDFKERHVYLLMSALAFLGTNATWAKELGEGQRPWNMKTYLLLTFANTFGGVYLGHLVLTLQHTSTDLALSVGCFGAIIGFGSSTAIIKRIISKYAPTILSDTEKAS